MPILCTSPSFLAIASAISRSTFDITSVASFSRFFVIAFPPSPFFASTPCRVVSLVASLAGLAVEGSAASDLRDTSAFRSSSTMYPSSVRFPPKYNGVRGGSRPSTLLTERGRMSNGPGQAGDSNRWSLADEDGGGRCCPCCLLPTPSPACLEKTDDGVDFLDFVNQWKNARPNSDWASVWFTTGICVNGSATSRHTDTGEEINDFVRFRFL